MSWPAAASLALSSQGQAGRITQDLVSAKSLAQSLQKETNHQLGDPKQTPQCHSLMHKSPVGELGVRKG